MRIGDRQRMSKEMIEREIIKYYDRETGRYVGEKRRENKYEILYDNRRSEIEEYGEGEEEEGEPRYIRVKRMKDKLIVTISYKSGRLLKKIYDKNYKKKILSKYKYKTLKDGTRIREEYYLLNTGEFLYRKKEYFNQIIHKWMNYVK